MYSVSFVCNFHPSPPPLPRKGHPTTVQSAWNNMTRLLIISPVFPGTLVPCEYYLCPAIFMMMNWKEITYLVVPVGSLNEDVAFALGREWPAWEWETARPPNLSSRRTRGCSLSSGVPRCLWLFCPIGIYLDKDMIFLVFDFNSFIK